MPKRKRPADPPAAPAPEPAPRADPTRITPAAAAALLSEEGRCTISPAQIAADLAAGCPANADGTLNLVVYCGWLLQQEE